MEGCGRGACASAPRSAFRKFRPRGGARQQRLADLEAGGIQPDIQAIAEANE